MLKFLRELRDFVRQVGTDSRIPERDRLVLAGMLALILSPIDIIPDWIPLLGVLDDLALLALVLDYLFTYLDQEILLSHYPWSMKSFVRLRRMARMVGWLAPGMLKRRIWKYQPDPLRRRGDD